MNDLSGLDWTSKPEDNKKTTIPNASYTFANLRPTPPVSGRATPLNGPASNPTPKSVTPANDNFASLVSFTSSNANKDISLQERQRRLAEEKKKQLLGKGNSAGGVDEHIWESLGSGRSTPAPSISVSGRPANSTSETDTQSSQQDEDDFLAVFNRPTSSTAIHTPKIETSGTLDGHLGSAQSQPASNGMQHADFEDDDDPFGLSQIKPSGPSTHTSVPARVDDEDDVLGVLAQPASSVMKPVPQPESTVPPTAHPQDQAIAELMDMGFPANKARQALESTESGIDVQAAVGYLLNQAHSESSQQSRPRHGNVRDEPGSALSQNRSRGRDANLNGADRHSGRQEYSAPSQAERAPTDVAAELSTKFLKTAGTFWKQSTKKFQQAVEEFNSDSDSSQPKWMREPEKTPSERRVETREDEAGVGRRRRRSSTARQESSATDEAMMLETARPEPRRAVRKRIEDSSADTSRDHSPAIPSRLREGVPPKPAFLRPQQSSAPAPKVTLSRAAVEEQASQAYVSSARRRKAPIAVSASASERDLLNNTAPSTLPLRPAASRSSQSATVAAKTVVKPIAPPRTIPPVSAIALKASNSQREAGNAHFKRGDYSSAHASYCTALSHLPQTHPITIILLTNKALTSLKIGEPKAAIVAADSAIALAGPAKGEREVVDFGTGDQPKPMREYYGKALMRKAEALEQMERWTDAAAVWQEAVEGGYGGATSIQGRARAEKAANLPAKAPVVRKAASTPARRPAPMLQKNSAVALRALRAANAAAEKADDEKFALADSVNAKLTAWKGSKADNLRALLSSLDLVLWPEAGWKKISMADLVLPNKVKIQYMKGIAKVHPDKISIKATTEQKMIAGAVFSTLNEAWDKFKAENGL